MTLLHIKTNKTKCSLKLKYKNEKSVLFPPGLFPSPAILKGLFEVHVRHHGTQVAKGPQVPREAGICACRHILTEKKYIQHCDHF